MTPRGCQVYVVGSILVSAVLAVVLAKISPKDEWIAFCTMFSLLIAFFVGIYGMLRAGDGVVKGKGRDFWAGFLAAVSAGLMALNFLFYEDRFVITNPKVNFLGAAAAVALALLIDEVYARLGTTAKAEK